MMNEDGLETVWRVGDDCVTQWTNGLFYQAKIVRVMTGSHGEKLYAVHSDDFDDMGVMVKHNQLRKPGDRPIVQVTHKLEDSKADEVVKKALSLSKADVPAGCPAYITSLCKELVNTDRCLDIDSWFFRLAPLLQDGVGLEETVVWQVCNKMIKQLVPLVGMKDGERRRSSEVYTKDNGSDTLLHVSKLTLGYMGKILLIRTTMHLKKSHRYGVVGENGAGKTTLMRKIASGTLPGFPKWIKTVYVQPDFDTDSDYITAFNFLAAAQREEQGEDCDPEVVNTLMADLQFTEKLKNSLIKELSGGWKMRVALARATMMRADILLLDEPTNHLDVNAVKWLETYLRSISTTVLVISHEPSFLDRVATDILYMKNQKLNHYAGNFSAFTAQQSGFSATDLEASALSGPNDALRFRFPDPGELVGINSRTRAVMNMKDVTFAYDKKRGNVLKGVKCRMSLSSRVAVCGPNGAGKSTLVKLLVGELEASQGNIWRHLNLRISYVAQHSFDHLEKVKNKPALAYIRQRFVRGFDSENAAYQHSENDEYKATMDFTGRTVEAILGRRKFKNSVAYEVKWKNHPESDNTWETEMRLQELGVKHLARQVDEKIRSKKSGIDQRPLTNKEITRHLGDFGLDKQYANSKIEGLSGGQKCKLVLAGAMWNKPHMLVLDEPTNYLDLDALQALAKAINRYKGGIVMVSHNKDFIGEICTEQWNIAEGNIDSVVEVKKQEKEVIETCEVPTENRGYDGQEQAAKIAAAKAAALPVGVGRLLGAQGIQAEDVAVRRTAIVELMDRQSKTNFGGPEARDRVFRAVVDCLKDTDDEVWTNLLKLGKAIAESHGDEKETKSLLEELNKHADELKVAAADLSATAAEEKAVLALKEKDKWHVGERIMARYAGDGQMYPAEILMVHPRKQGFDIIFTEYNEKAKIRHCDAERVTNQPRPKTAKKAVSKKAQAAEAEEAVENRGRAGVLVLKAAVVNRLDLTSNLDVVKATATSLMDVLSRSATAGNVGMRKASCTTVSVHEAMSNALVSLLKNPLGFDTQQLIQQSFDEAVNNPNENVRTGASHCLAAILKGMGAKAMREFGLIDKLSKMLTKDAPVNERIAVLMMYPRLFHTLGSIIEYKATDFIPALLAALKDRNKELVTAAQEASRVLMASLSIHGARIILPILLAGLDAKDWKAKVQHVRVLQAVSYCSEDLMSEELPIIVPKLMHVMSSPRKEVQKAAEKAFDQIGSIIANPEIKPLVPSLLDAVRDATKHTQSALEKLTHTSFAYAVDSPSLALLMPIVFNGMKDRKIECKKAAMKVVDALCALIMDVKYMAPYCADLLARLKVYLVYSMPDVRAVAAKALGTLYNEMGEDFFPNLLTYLLDSLKGNDVSPHQISGAARGLCFCTHALGIERTKELLPGLLQQTKSELSNVRAGHFELFVVMPEVFSDSFRQHFLEPIFPVCLAGISDGVLAVQEAAMCAAQELVSRHARTNLMFMLPFIMQGLDNKDAKIRTCFLQIVGTLFLNMVVDTNFSQTVKFWGHGNQLAEDEIANEATKEQEEIIRTAFGDDVRNETFAKLYLMRSDESEGVGQMAWRVWHLVVPDERSLLQTLLSMLIDRIVANLSGSDATRRKQGKASLSHLVLSLGDAGLARIVPMLHEHLKTEDHKVRQAVCMGFTEIMRTAAKGDIGAYLNDIIPSIRDMLIDPVPEVRPTAALAFSQLYKNVGTKAIDKIVPLLLETLREGKHAESLVDGISVVLGKCEMNAYFNLSLRILTKLSPTTTDASSVDFLMRELLVNNFCTLAGKAEGMECERTFKALQRFCETMPVLKESYFDKFIIAAFKRTKDQRGNIRNSSRNLLYFAFDFDKDAEKGAKDAYEYFKANDMRESENNEIVDALKKLKAESELSQSLEQAFGEEKNEAPAAAAANGAAAAAPTEQLAKDEKRCSKCQKVLKVKSYSKKQFKSKTPTCKMCCK